jgi:hypothetical protein
MWSLDVLSGTTSSATLLSGIFSMGKLSNMKWFKEVKYVNFSFALHF